MAEAREALAAGPDAAFIVLSGDWPVGVIGLLAGRIAEEEGRPTLVLSTAADPWRGSARSAGGVDLAAAFADCADLFERFGGHPAAAGCHVDPEHVAGAAEAPGGVGSGHGRRSTRGPACASTSSRAQMPRITYSCGSWRRWRAPETLLRSSASRASP